MQRRLASAAPPILLTIVVVAIILVSFLTPPISWLPEAGNNETLLGTFLAAQAAIAALTLAVTLFVMQGVSNKPDADDRMYREYFRRSWVRHIFWGSLIAAFATGIILLIDLFVGEANGAPGIRNLIIVAAVAFLTLPTCYSQVLFSNGPCISPNLRSGEH